RRHTRSKRDWSSDVCSSDLDGSTGGGRAHRVRPDRTRTVVVSGAEVLPEEEIAQVLTAAKESGVEVVLMFRTGVPAALSRFADRSEERRVGKECSSRGGREH